VQQQQQHLVLLFFQKGDTGPTGPQGPQGPSGNPSSITWALPLSYNPTTTTASIDLSNNVDNTSFINFSTSSGLRF
jgi:hypothetical protein